MGSANRLNESCGHTTTIKLNSDMMNKEGSSKLIKIRNFAALFDKEDLLNLTTPNRKGEADIDIENKTNEHKMQDIEEYYQTSANHDPSTSFKS